LITIKKLIRHSKVECEGFFPFKFIIAIFFVLLCFSSIEASADLFIPFVDDASEEQDYLFAVGLYRDSLFQLAGEQFEAFIIKYPNSSKRHEATFLSAECLFHSGQYQGSISKYKRFIKEYPTSNLIPDALIRIGQCYISQKRYDEAIATLKTVLEEYNESNKAGEATYWIGEAFLKKDDDNNAIKYYSLSYENYPDNRVRDYALYSIAWTYQKRKDYKNALDWYLRVISEFPSSLLASKAYVRIAECYYASKDFYKVISHLDSSKSKIIDEEESGNADFLIAEAYDKQNDLLSAQKQYEKFLFEHPDHSLLKDAKYALGRNLIKQKKYNDALNILDELIQGKDEIAEAALYQRSVVERSMGKIDKALNTLETLHKINPNGDWSDNALFDLGLIFFGENNIAKAKQYFDLVVKGFSDSDVLPDSYRMLGECLIAEGDYKGAQNYFIKAITFPDAKFDVKVAAEYQNAFCSFKLKQYNDAIAQFADFSKKYPEHPRCYDAMYYQAESNYILGNFDEAIRIYKEILKSSGSRREESLYGIAWSYFKQEKFQQAIEYFNKLLVEYPKSKLALDSRLRKGDSFFFMKDYKNAIESYRLATRLYPDSIAVDYAHYQIGQCYYKQGDYSNAYNAFETLIKTFPKSQLADDAQFAKGWLSFQRKEYKDAINEFEKVLNNFKNSELVPRAYCSIGDSYYNMKQYDDAERAYNEVLKKFPQSKYVIDAITGIQYCLMAEGKNVDILSIIDDVIKKNPTLSSMKELQLMKGEILLDRGKYIEAMNIFEQFIKSEKEPAILAKSYLLLGKSYKAQGKMDEAKSAFEKASANLYEGSKIYEEAVVNIAEIYMLQKKNDELIEYIKNKINLIKDPYFQAKSRILFADALKKNGQPKEAVNQYIQVIRDFGDLSIVDNAKVALARIYYETGEFDKAITIAEDFVKGRKDELGAEAQYIIGSSYRLKGDWNSAVTALLRVKYLFSPHEYWLSKAYLELGYVYEQLKDTKKARESYQSVLKLKSNPEVIEEARKRIQILEQR